MVKTNGLHYQDPDYNDFGYSDFLSDYVVDDETLDEWIADRCDEVLDWFKKGWTLKDVQDYWKEQNEDVIEKEWGNDD